jgi:hypothetical protein
LIYWCMVKTHTTKCQMLKIPNKLNTQKAKNKIFRNMLFRLKKYIKNVFFIFSCIFKHLFSAKKVPGMQTKSVVNFHSLSA